MTWKELGGAEKAMPCPRCGTDITFPERTGRVREKCPSCKEPYAVMETILADGPSPTITQTACSVIERIGPIASRKFDLVGALATNDGLGFPDLKENPQMPDGNLSVHLRVLEESGYVVIEKGVVSLLRVS